MTTTQIVLTLVAAALPWLVAVTLTFNRHGATIVGLYSLMVSLAGLMAGIGLVFLLHDVRWLGPFAAFMASSLVLAFGADTLHNHRCTCDPPRSEAVTTPPRSHTAK